MKKNELIEKLKKEIENKKPYLQDISCDLVGDYQNYLDSSSYICDIISEYADQRVDIYTSDLLEWAKDNYTYIENAIDEFGTPTENGKSDFARMIMQGQYLKNYEDLSNDLNDIIKILAYTYILEQENEIDNEKEFDFLDLEIDIEELDHNNQLEDIKYYCDKFINNDDEE